jgi:hypothetical protein
MFKRNRTDLARIKLRATEGIVVGTHLEAQRCENSVLRK